MPINKKDLPSLLGLTVLLIGFFWPVITGNAFLGIDFPEWFHPFRQYAAVELRSGHMPFWNPYLFGGIPFFAMIDTAIFYPLNWLFIPLVQNGTLSFLMVEWHIIGHIFLLGAGTYFFCRNLNISRSGSFIAALTWMLSGTVVHQTYNGSLIETIAWLPFILLVFSSALEKLSIRWAIFTGILWALAILAGHPQMFVYIAYMMGFYYLFCLIECYRSSDPWRDALRMTGLFTTVIAIGLGLSAVTLLPAYELIGFSQRGNIEYDTVASYTLDPRQIITFFMPDFFGQMTMTRWDYWGPFRQAYGHFWETYIYLGILSPLLAGTAIVMVRGRMIRFFGSIALLCSLLIFGSATPLFRLATLIIPGFDLFRSHSRLGFLLGFSVAVLAGYGLDALRHKLHEEKSFHHFRWYIILTGGMAFTMLLSIILEIGPMTGWLAGSVEFQENARNALRDHSNRFILVTIFSFFILAGWYWLRARTRILIIATTGLIAADLLSVGWDFNQSPLGPESYFPRDNLVRTLEQQQRQGGGRISYRSGSFGLMKRNAGVVFRIAAMEGFASPLRLARTTPPTTQDRVFDLMNVTYHIRMLEDGKTATFVFNEDAMPRVFVVRDYVVTDHMDAVAQAMADTSFDYRTMVTLDQPPGILIEPDSVSVIERPVITRYEPNRIDISGEMLKPGILVLGEVFYPAWRAYINGQEQQVLRANGTLRAIVLPAGPYNIVFRYQSMTVLVGTLLSVMTLLSIIGVLSWRNIRKKQEELG